MSFDLAWLDLREPADHAARDRELLTAAAGLVAGADPLVVDLGAGSGSTLRACDGIFPERTRWRLVDRDERLLHAARERHGAQVEPVTADLVAVEALPLDGACLVTASALLDLVSEQWLVALADRLGALGCGIYAALSYDGRMEWHPCHPLDADVADAFDAHQRRDKGFGPALGPAAASRAAQVFAARGFEVRMASSPWRLGHAEAPLRDALIDGVASAATEQGFGGAAAWAHARRAASTGMSCTVGHADLLAVPPASRAQSNTTSLPSP